MLAPPWPAKKCSHWPRCPTASLLTPTASTWTPSPCSRRTHEWTRSSPLHPPPCSLLLTHLTRTIQLSTERCLCSDLAKFPLKLTSKEFFSESILLYRVELEKYNVDCAVCGESFSSKAAFSTHIKNHNIERDCNDLDEEEQTYICEQFKRDH